MPKSVNQKLKLLYLQRLLLEKTDEDHLLTVKDIISELKRWDIEVERKTVYSDIKALEKFGHDIVCKKNKCTGYYICERDFQLPELKLLADAVASAKFISEKKSQILLQKLGLLASHHESRQIRRNIMVRNRVKTMNEQVYYNVDAVNQAIAEKKQITFKYFDYNLNKERVYRQNGGSYSISPYALFWDDENYYVIAYHKKYDDISNFRIDRMDSVELLNENCTPLPENFSVGDYARKTFSMFRGPEERVHLKLKNHLINVILDKFGKDVYINKIDDNHFKVSINVCVSTSFFGWLFQFGDEASILSPEHVLEAYQNRARNLLEE
ncbi:MAG: WYL domain-containing transcriptional regulator [Firmicutes bacterium]|nr:WYL domain-containing transcriptional regulator [Bacillota bacterium]